MKRLISWLIIIIIFSLGLQVLIIYRNHTLDYDEQVYFDLAKNITQQGLPVSGSTREIYLAQPFLGLYFFSLPLLFSSSQVMARSFCSLLSVVIIILTYVIGKKIFNQTAGLIACFLLAVHPLFLTYSHSLYLEPLLTLFLMLAVLFFVRGLQEKPLFFFWAGVFLGLGLLTKFLGLAILAGLSGYLLIFRKKSPRKKFCLFLLPAIFLGLGWLAFALLFDWTGFVSQFSFFFRSEFLGQNNPDPRVGVGLVKYIWAVIIVLTPVFFLTSLTSLFNLTKKRLWLLPVLIGCWSLFLLLVGVKELRFWYPILPILTINLGSFLAGLPKKLRIIILILIIVNYFLIFRGTNLFYWRLKLRHFIIA